MSTGFLGVLTYAMKGCWELPISSLAVFSLMLLEGCYTRSHFAGMRHTSAISLEKAHCEVNIPVLKSYSQQSGKELFEGPCKMQSCAPALSVMLVSHWWQTKSKCRISKVRQEILKQTWEFCSDTSLLNEI